MPGVYQDISMGKPWGSFNICPHSFGLPGTELCNRQWISGTGALTCEWEQKWMPCLAKSRWYSLGSSQLLSEPRVPHLSNGRTNTCLMSLPRCESDFAPARHNLKVDEWTVTMIMTVNTELELWIRPGVFSVLSQLVSTTIILDGYHYDLPFTHTGTQAQRGKRTCSLSLSKW